MSHGPLKFSPSSSHPLRILLILPKSLVFLGVLLLILGGLVSLGVGLVFSGCGENVFKPFAKTDTDEALYETALKCTDDLDYTCAVNAFSKMSSSYLQKVNVKRSYAGALAGDCGLRDLASYVQQLGSASTGQNNSTFFLLLMRAFQGKAVNPKSCSLAQDQILSIPSTEMNNGDHFNLAILSLVKMGAYLRNKADNSDGTDSLGDGTTDAVYDSCLNTSNGPHNLDDKEITEIVTGFSNLMTNIVYVGAVLSNDLNNVLLALDTLCSMANPNPCLMTRADAVDTTTITFFRNLLATGPNHPTTKIGIGSCIFPIWGDCCSVPPGP